jgi:microcystin degradation protein MlrC
VLDLALGGRGETPGADPLVARYRVEALGNGQFAGTGGYYNGARLNFGPMALLRIEGSGVRVVVGSQRAQAGTQAILRHLGLEPAAQGIIGLKSSVHFLADFGALTSNIIYAAFPGLNTADPAAFAYRDLRSGIRRRPKTSETSDVTATASCVVASGRRPT